VRAKATRRAGGRLGRRRIGLGRVQRGDDSAARMTGGPHLSAAVARASGETGGGVLGRLGQARLVGCDARDAGPWLAGQQLGRCRLLRGLDRGLLLLLVLEGKNQGG
jgi:hypothetical protein